MIRTVALWVVAVILIGVLLFLTLGASFVDGRMNTVIAKPPYTVSPAAQANEPQCPAQQQPAKPAKDQAPAKQHAGGGHVVAVRMGWEAG